MKLLYTKHLSPRWNLPRNKILYYGKYIITIIGYCCDQSTGCRILSGPSLSRVAVIRPTPHTTRCISIYICVLRTPMTMTRINNNGYYNNNNTSVRRVGILLYSKSLSNLRAFMRLLVRMLYENIILYMYV